MDTTYGRNRQSVTDIEQELYRIFEEHPDSELDDTGTPVIPASALTDVFAACAELWNGVPLLNADEERRLQDLLSDNPGLACTPTIILQYIAEKTKSTPPPTPGSGPGAEGAQGEDFFDDDDDDTRVERLGHQQMDETEDYSRTFGFGHEHDDQDHTARRRVDSGESDASQPPQTQSQSGLSIGIGSRPPSRASPITPGKNPLDSTRRQRTTPMIINAAPSAWSGRRPVPARRKSDAGSRSDSEYGTSPSHRGPRRGRGPSQPPSPSSATFDLGYPNAPGGGSRPGSRMGGHRSNYSREDATGYSSSEDYAHRTMNQRRPSRYDAFDNDVNSLPMPRSGGGSAGVGGGNDDGSDSEDDEDEISRGLVVPERPLAESNASMEQEARLDALSRTNTELARKLADAERTLQMRLTQHEEELEECQVKIDELRSELASANREEKELRSKDGRNLTQIAALEAEIAKVTKTLESSRATYASLQRQYQEQCAASEKYRDELRQRAETIQALQETLHLQEVEVSKYVRERETYEERIVSLEKELEMNLETQGMLDEQKQENLMLKETIDRMRYEMDRMRNDASAVGLANTSGTNSVNGTISKSLGAELAGKLGAWGEEGDDEPSTSSSQPAEEQHTGNDDDDSTESEIEEIITRRTTRKVPRVKEERKQFVEIKDYSHTGVQYDATLFNVNHGMQTDDEPKAIKVSFSVQTEAREKEKEYEPRQMCEMDIQTDPVYVRQLPTPAATPEPEPVASTSSPSSSSSTLSGPSKTSTSTATPLDEADAPPSYDRIAEETRWHAGANLPLGCVPSGVKVGTVEDWERVKKEFGVSCAVIDKMVENSEVAAEDKTEDGEGSGKKPRRSGRLHNIYNTYVYGTSSPASSHPPNSHSALTSSLLFISASALVLLAVTPYVLPHYASHVSGGGVPGGATYYDRAAWQSFNSMAGGAGEGFVMGFGGRGGGAMDYGTKAVWSVLGRVGGGAARMARGWPT